MDLLTATTISEEHQKTEDGSSVIVRSPLGARRVALGELPPNTASPRAKPISKFSKLANNNTAYKFSNIPPPEIFRPGSPLKQAYTLGNSSPASEVRGKKRKASDVENQGQQERLVSPVMLRKDDLLAVETGVSCVAVEDLSSTEEDSDAATPTRVEQHAEPEVCASQDSTATKESVSFSSLIDYNPRNSSQRGSSPAECTECETPVHPQDIKSKIEMLRLRLRLGMYKVETKQTGVPLHALTPQAARRSKTSAIQTRNTALQTNKSTQPRARILSVDVAASAPLRQSFPQLSAVPTLLPTPYSSQNISYKQAISDADPPSSPPSRSPKRVRSSFAAAVAEADANVDAEIRRRDHNDLATPTANRHSMMQSPAKSDGSRGGSSWDTLTSSVVKGKVAAGLLELRRGG